MISLPRDVTNIEIELAQEMFNLGFKVSYHEQNFDYKMSTYKKTEILSKVNNDKAMTCLLQELFESGKSVGEKRKEDINSEIIDSVLDNKETLPLHMLGVLKEVNQQYGSILGSWYGTFSELDGLEDIIGDLMKGSTEDGVDGQGFGSRFNSVKDIDDHIYTLIGDNLREYIRVADMVIKEISTMRTELGIRANIPIKNVAIKCSNEEVRDALIRLKTPVLNEVNAKNLDIVPAGEEWRGMKLEIVLNRDAIDRAYNQQARKIETLLKYQSPWKIKHAMEKAQEYTLGVEGYPLKITPGMLEFTVSIPETVMVKEFDPGTIYLDKEVTEELWVEGMSKDIIEHLNRIRKELKIKDDEYLETKIFIDGRAAELLAGCTELISQKTNSYVVELVTENIFEDEDSGYKITELEVDGVTILIGIAIIEWEEE